jgi:dihydrofolate synthase/folylpolyglutamate synthase
MTEYEALLGRLLPARRFGIDLGLGRVRDLLDRLGAPDRRLGAIVHVGGTNGKGSTVAMIAALAGTHGRVATYTSPHLSSLRERIAIDGAPIDEGGIVAAARVVQGAGGDRLTFFEQITAIACVAIAEARVAVTVLEVGLGGRLDATNAIDAPIAVVTGVAMDHEAILGGTLEAIAAEKGGIFKRGQRVVIGASGEPEAVPYLDRAARAAGASVITVIDDAAVAAVPPVGLAGAHQRRNAATALAALDQLEVLGVVRVSPAARARALAGVRHPGRFEEIAGPPRIILDGAHNPHGARALAGVLAERGERPVLVVAVSADKDVAGIAAALAPAVRAVVATRYRQERSLDPAALAAAFRDAARAAGHAGGASETTPAAGAGQGPSELPVEEAPDLPAALAAARRHGEPILVAGSLFLVGEARVLLLGAPADPIAVSDPSVPRG